MNELITAVVSIARVPIRWTTGQVALRLLY